MMILNSKHVVALLMLIRVFACLNTGFCTLLGHAINEYGLDT